MSKILKDLFDIKNSIVRKSVLVFLVVLPGFVMNYALLFFAGRILDSDKFGILYTSITIVNIMFAPAVSMGFYFSREITRKLTEDGYSDAVKEFKIIFNEVLIFGGILALWLMLIFTFVGSMIGVNSILLLLIISLTVFGSYLAEMVRAGLQGLHYFFIFAFASILWLTFRLLFGVYGLSKFGSVWAGMGGIMMSALPVIILFYFFILRNSDKELIKPNFKNLRIKNRKLLIFMASYGIFSLAMYFDVIMAYLMFDKSDLSVYSASSILPKSVIIILLPLVQVLFPIFVKNEKSKELISLSLIKGGLLTFFSSGVGTLGLIFLGGFFINSFMGIEMCDVGLMKNQALYIIPLCLLRVVIMFQFSRGYDKQPFLLLGLILIFVVYLVSNQADLFRFSQIFVAFSWITLLFYSIFGLRIYRMRNIKMAMQYFLILFKFSKIKD